MRVGHFSCGGESKPERAACGKENSPGDCFPARRCAGGYRNAKRLGRQARKTRQRLSPPASASLQTPYHSQLLSKSQPLRWVVIWVWERNPHITWEITKKRLMVNLYWPSAAFVCPAAVPNAAQTWQIHVILRNPSCPVSTGYIGCSKLLPSIGILGIFEKFDTWFS